MPAPRIVFSDLDGTLVHFERHFREHGRVEEDTGDGFATYVCRTSGERRRSRLLPTSTMGPGLLSDHSAELIRRIRARGVEFAYITGARKSTLLERLPMLPDADLAIAETGGRMYDRGQLDAEWTRGIERYSGPIDTALPPLEREGVLWDWYRSLTREGFKVDSRSYTCCFRVDAAKALTGVPAARAEERLAAAVRRMPRGVTCAQNLGKHDFFPAVSGKGNAVRHVIRKRGYSAADAIAMFDDDNDLPMAREVGLCMVTQATHGAVRDAVQANPHWVVARRHGPLAAEELLGHVLRLCGDAAPPPPPRHGSAAPRL